MTDYLMGIGWVALCLAWIGLGAAMMLRRPHPDAVGLLHEAASYFDGEPGEEADAIRRRLREMANQLEGKP